MTSILTDTLYQYLYVQAILTPQLATTTPQYEHALHVHTASSPNTASYYQWQRTLNMPVQKFRAPFGRRLDGTPSGANDLEPLRRFIDLDLAGLDF